MVGRWTCSPEVRVQILFPATRMDLSSVAPNSTPPRLVTGQPPTSWDLLLMFNFYYICNTHLIIFIWSLRDKNVHYCYYYYYYFYYCYYYYYIIVFLGRFSYLKLISYILLSYFCYLNVDSKGLKLSCNKHSKVYTVLL